MPVFKIQLPVGNSADREACVIWPAGWDMTNGFLRKYHLDDGTDMGFHTGIDLLRPSSTTRGQPVFAIGAGKVMQAAPIAGSRTWGNVVVIYHGEVDGHPLFSRYAHLQTIAEHVQHNAEVNLDIPIGTVGSGPPNSGMVAHLHFDICKTQAFTPGTGDGHGPGNWPFKKHLVEKNYENTEIWFTEQHFIDRDANGNPVSDDQLDHRSSPGRIQPADLPSRTLWEVKTTTEMRVGPQLDSPGFPVGPGASFLLESNALEQFLDNSLWVQISDLSDILPRGWVKKKDNSQTFISPIEPSS